MRLHTAQQQKTQSPWEDITKDYLEVKSRLSNDRLSSLLAKLDDAGILTGEVTSLVCFSIQSNIIILSEASLENLWIYTPRTNKLDQAKLS